MANIQKKAHRYDKFQKAEEKIAANQWDVEAWCMLLREAQNRTIDDAREMFERIVTQFPMNGQYWRVYIQQEIRAKNYDRVEKLFQRCLVKILHIDLWKLYLQYIHDTKANLPNFKEKMAQAFDFTLDKMGLDLSFYSVWNDYITFLRAAQVHGSFAESQKITATRRVYQRAIVTPMLGIETMWRDYCLYENSINVDIAKKLTEERTRDYTNARRVAKELEQITKGLSKNMPSVPPQNTPYEAKQVELWKKYIQWEKDNPLKTDDLIVITKRVIFAYEQCLLCLGHHPDIWYEAASYLEQASKQLTEKGENATANQFAAEASCMFERAIALLSNNILLYFAYADYEETRGKIIKVHSIYQKLIALESIDPTLPYIQYMRACRRFEGIVAARGIFKKAREDPRTGHHVYVAAATMEYFCSKDSTIAHRIFDMGLRRYGNSAEYMQAYLDFMNYLNEDNNTRVLFERSLGATAHLPTEKTCQLWTKYLQYESQVGDLASILKVEKRRQAALENVREYQRHETSLLIDRYRFLDLFPCSDSELRSLGYRDSMVHVNGLPVANAVEDAPPEPAQTASGYVESVVKKLSYPKPDVTQMLPFKPKAYPRVGSHVVPGGEFPPPPAASSLIKMMPPPDCFHGPFVHVDKFMEYMLEMDLPADYFTQVAAESEQFADSSIDPGTALSIELASSASFANTLMLNRKRKSRAASKKTAKASKRHLNAFGDSESENEAEDEDGQDASSEEDPDDETGKVIKDMRHEAMLMNANSGGFMDLFRMRQAKKQLK